jgi:hypothetical protein
MINWSIKFMESVKRGRQGKDTEFRIQGTYCEAVERPVHQFSLGLAESRQLHLDDRASHLIKAILTDSSSS